MAKPIEPFVPISGDESFEERVAAFNRAGTNINALHECVDAGFSEAKAARDEIAENLAAYIARTDIYHDDMRTKSEATLNRFLTVEGQLRAISDDQTLKFEGIEGRLKKTVDGIETSVKVLTDHRAAEEKRASGAKKFLAAILVATVASTVATMAGATFLYLTNAHNHETTHKEIADRTSDRYTADDAARDRAAQELREKKFLEALTDLDGRIKHAEHAAKARP